MKKTSKQILIFSLIFLITFVIRLWKINSIPSVISHDEIFYPTQAKTLAMSGRGLTGDWRPRSLTSEVELYAELPGVIMTPAALIFQNNPLMASKITHLLAASGLVLVLSLISYSFSKKTSFAIITALIATFNPWLWQFSRMGFDSLLSLFFYFLGLYLLIELKNWQKLLSFPALFLGFFQYQGLKVVFLPLVFIAALVSFLKDKGKKNLQQGKKQLLPIVTIILLSLLLFAGYLFQVKNQPAGNRLNFLVFNDQQYIEQTVNLKRAQTLNNPLVETVFNKASIIGLRFIEQYLNTLDLKQWFFELEIVRNPFAVYQHGLFYVLDLFLIILALILIWQKKKDRPLGIFLTSTLFIAPLPATIVSTGSWLVFRASLMIPIGILLIAYSFYWLWEKAHKIIFYTLSVGYLIFVAYFFYIYFQQYPLTGTRDQYFAEKIIAQYIKRQADQKIIIIAPEPGFVFQEILIHNNLINKSNLEKINQAFKTETYQLENFEVLGERCVPQDENNIIYMAHSNVRPCEGNDSPLNYNQIPSLLDSGGIYRVYQDKLCENYDLARFITIKENVFNFKTMSDLDFCQNFIIHN